MDGYDPYNNFFMASTADPSNYYSQGGYSAWQNQMVSPDPQASYNQSDDPYAPPSGEQAAYRRSSSQVPGTSGAPPETPSATPGGVSSGVGTGVPNSYPSLANIFGGLSGGQGGGQGQSQPNALKQTMTLGQMGMRMMNPNNPQQQQQQQNPQVQQIARLYGVDYQTALALMQMMQRNQQPQAASQALPQMQFGGRPIGPTIVGERGPEIFTPDVPGTISPSPYMARRFGMPPIGQYR